MSSGPKKVKLKRTGVVQTTRILKKPDLNSEEDSADAQVEKGRFLDDEDEELSVLGRTARRTQPVLDDDDDDDDLEPIKNSKRTSKPLRKPKRHRSLPKSGSDDEV
jgi:uncharacterized protein YcbK (DUF882 family)